ACRISDDVHKEDVRDFHALCFQFLRHKITLILGGDYERLKPFRALLEPIHQREIAASGGKNDEIHDDKQGVVAPAVCSRCATEASVPCENLFPDRAQHDPYQPDCSELS